MKTFISALIIFAVLCTLVCTASAYIKKETGALAELALALPASPNGFRNSADAEQKTEELQKRWVRCMAVFPYIMSYEMLDRADDAVLSLAAAAKAGCAEDFLSARLRFIDAIGRLSRLFALSPESIF